MGVLLLVKDAADMSSHCGPLEILLRLRVPLTPVLYLVAPSDLGRINSQQTFISGARYQRHFHRLAHLEKYHRTS